jgi:hypothetical protein
MSGPFANWPRASNLGHGYGAPPLSFANQLGYDDEPDLDKPGEYEDPEDDPFYDDDPDDDE